MTWIALQSGLRFDFADPRPGQVDIRDVAAALSRVPRFAGHTPHFYSVAQHSVLVSHLVGDPALEVEALLHDAHEAYLGDLPTPLKALLGQAWAGLDRRVRQCVALAFSVAADPPPAVRAADRRALAIEARQFFPGLWREMSFARDLDLRAWAEQTRIRLPHMDPPAARQHFLERWHHLKHRTPVT